MKRKANVLKKACKTLLLIFVISLASGSTGQDSFIVTGYNKNLSKASDFHVIDASKEVIVEEENIPEQVISKEDIEETVTNKEYPVLETFKGVLTAYGYDCIGCIGITASGYDIRNNNIYYEDKDFGTLRIIAADYKYPFGTVMRITEGEKQVIAIVLDRGGAIYTGNVDADLVVSSESVAIEQVGKWNHATFEVLRYGYTG